MSFATNKILLLFFCGLFFNSIAQKEFHTFTKSDGLTSSNILITKVDHKGIIWAGTNSGINAFTGEEWVPIKSISDSKGNKNNIGRVFRFFEAINGDFWVVSEKGLFVFNGEYWTYFNDTENDGFHVTDIFEDRRGWIWVIMEKTSSLKDIGDIGFSLVDGIIQMYNGQRWHKFPSKIGGSAAVTIGDPMEYFTSHIQDVKGNIWVTNLDGLYKFDGKQWEEFNEEQLPSDICYKVIETSEKEIWVATKYGIAKLVGDDWVKFEKNRGLKGNQINNLFEDEEKRIWTTTRKDNRFSSICVYNNGKWKPFFKDKVKIKGAKSQLIDFDNQLIVFSKKGIFFYEEKKWNSLDEKYNIIDDNFANLTVLKNSSLCFSGEKGLYSLVSDSLQLLLSPEKTWKVTSIFESSKGEIWVGTEKKGVYVISSNEAIKYTVDNGLNDNFIKEIFEDKQRNIWIVTKSGISKFL